MRKIAIILTFIISACGNKNFTSEDLKNNSEVLPFVLLNDDLNGEHDLDLGKLTFSYTPKSNSGSVLNEISSKALKNNWSVVDSGKDFIKFEKKIESFPADNQTTSVLVHYSNNIVQVTWN